MLNSSIIKAKRWERLSEHLVKSMDASQQEKALAIMENLQNFGLITVEKGGKFRNEFVYNSSSGDFAGIYFPNMIIRNKQGDKISGIAYYSAGWNRDFVLLSDAPASNDEGKDELAIYTFDMVGSLQISGFSLKSIMNTEKHLLQSASILQSKNKALNSLLDVLPKFSGKVYNSKLDTALYDAAKIRFASKYSDCWEFTSYLNNISYDDDCILWINGSSNLAKEIVKVPEGKVKQCFYFTDELKQAIENKISENESTIAELKQAVKTRSYLKTAEKFKKLYEDFKKQWDENKNLEYYTKHAISNNLFDLNKVY